MDDERRRYYRLTPLGKAVAEAEEAGRLRDLLKMARLCGVRAQDNLMNFYRLLLHLYPWSFRAEYGDEMSAIFALQLRRRGGLRARCGLWLSAVGEVVCNAALLHWEITRRNFFHSTRSLLRSPAFTLTAVLLVTIGICVYVARDYVGYFCLGQATALSSTRPVDESLGKTPRLFKDGTFPSQLSRSQCVEQLVCRFGSL